MLQRSSALNAGKGLDIDISSQAAEIEHADMGEGSAHSEGRGRVRRDAEVGCSRSSHASYAEADGDVLGRIDRKVLAFADRLLRRGRARTKSRDFDIRILSRG